MIQLTSSVDIRSLADAQFTITVLLYISSLRMIYAVKGVILFESRTLLGFPALFVVSNTMMVPNHTGVL